MGFLARLTRTTLAVLAFAAAGTVNAARVAPEPPFTVDDTGIVQVTATRVAGMPGETVTVAFTVKYMSNCEVYFATAPRDAKFCRGRNAVTLAVPEGAGPTQVMWRVAADQEPQYLSGDFAFTVLAKVTATVKPDFAERGKQISVTLDNPDALEFSSCTVRLRDGEAAACDTGVAVLPVPANPPGDPLVVSVDFAYTYRHDYTFPDQSPVTVKDTGAGRDSVRVPLSPPLPVFDAQPQTRTAAPGLPFVVVFQSLTPGVTFKDCVVRFHGEVRCSPSGVAVVDIPRDTAVGSTIAMHWQVFYTSTRPGELPGPVEGDIKAKVVASQPDVIVTVQPAQGEPGDEVTVALQPVDEDVTLLDCMTFFPHGPGAICQRSPERWFTRTIVPPDALPGIALLRWGVTSLTAGERRATPTGGVPFKVLKRVDKPTTKPPVDGPSLPPTGGPTPPPTASTPDNPQEQQTQTTPPVPPVFVAVTDPEGADPGQPVSVTIQPLTAGTTITGCRAAFDGTETATCRPAGGNWTARVTVPDNAAPGDLPLQWDVTDTGGQGGGGTINYRVLGAGIPPQVRVVLDPTEAKAGGNVKVTPYIDDKTVTITGCRAAYLPDGKLAECHNDGRGWVADVPLPQDAPGGSATLFWRVAYARSGGDGATDGNVTIPVVADQRSWWDKLVGVLWPRGAGALGLLTALAVAGYQGWRRRQRALRQERDDPAAGFSVDLKRLPGATATTTGDGDAPPRLVVRLTLHRGVSYIRGEERR
ncbi:hypothetical protein HH310_16645 [Actinoplanes sp. TBRC 11911]|uniref:hypothetical protein n=1 Tax=Actinoplanes sp. TBRC 11911 TaxID=2729386 RepID=UPI00145C44B6|nr:hypothetical protein [Actinoplanes sp. TBRC 11911]NMO52814.1 hypothetical protein [Actinoplanes sp. TBRC 11911]